VDKQLYISFREKIKFMSDYEYLKAIISYHIAPVIYSSKPSSIINLYKSEHNLSLLWELYKDYIVKEYGIEYFELKKNEKNIVILFYNRELLSDTIYDASNLCFLKTFGYKENFTLEEYLYKLKERFSEGCPHEMGLFLGFPLEDVQDFISMPYKKCLLTGYWMVYNNLKYAEKQFEKYDEAKKRIISKVLQKNNI
jgi:hypothetical protein